MVSVSFRDCVSYLAVSALAIGRCVSVYAGPAADSALSPTRVVCRFDFDERAAGNLEDIPKYWEPIRPPGFPRYAYGAFDFDTGRLAPPSFHLSAEGRNVMYHYAGPETRVRRNSDYRIEGFIRPDRLMYGRACLSAHFLDKRGRPIRGTLVRSRYVGGPSDDGKWVRVDLRLAPPPREAYTIGLSAWVLRESVWNTAVPPRRHIPLSDVHGGAWFDDIAVYALPHVEIATSAPGNVLTAGKPQELRVVLADDEDPTLYGRLSIRGADGEMVETHEVRVTLDTADAPPGINVSHLSPGLYHARIDVFSRQTTIASRELTFARVGPLHRGSEAAARSFGVVIDPRRRSDPAIELALLRQQAVRRAKLPVWTGLAEDARTTERRRADSLLFQDLVKNGFSLTGVFWGPPARIARGDGTYVQPLIELLAGKPEAWREHLAAVVAPNASALRSWQVGPDPPPDDIVSAPKDELTRAITQLREAIGLFITAPRLAVAATTDVEPIATKTAAEEITLALGSAMPPDRFAPPIEHCRSLGYDAIGAYVEPLPGDKYRRVPRLADWAQRIIAARHAGADIVFVPQTWVVHDTPKGRTAEPTEGYVILRTIADMLANAEPGPRLHMAEGVWALAFHDGQSTTLAMWDTRAPPDGRRHSIQLGRADHRIDLWGRSKPLLPGEDGRHIVRLTPLPIFVPGVERWLIDFRSSLALDPRHVDSGVELARHTVKMAYRGDRALSGRVVLDVSESWEIQPRVYTFSLMPRRASSQSVKIRFPHNEPAGEKSITAKVTLTGEPYYLEVPLDLDVSVTDLDVWGMASVEGDELLLRHVVSNRSAKVLNFRASAAVPGRERKYRPVSQLRPGDTQTVEYRFADGADLIGRTARLVLREVNDGPRVSNLELTIP